MRVYAFGESLIDVINKADGSVASKAGGSLLNMSVSMARSGADVSLITDYGNDVAGQMLHAFLQKENVGIEYVSRYTNGQTALAFALLDEQAKATYSFYKNYPKERFAGFKIPEFTSESCFAFGSFSSIAPELQTILKLLLDTAEAAKSVIYFDPNIRHQSHLKQESAMEYLLRNFRAAQLIRASNEDLQTIFQTDDLQQVIQKCGLSSDVPFIVTRGSDKISCAYKHQISTFEVPQLPEVESTIGAGDSFNAGLLTYLDMNHIGREGLRKLDENQLAAMVATAVAFSTDACQTTENYIRPVLAERLRMLRSSL